MSTKKKTILNRRNFLSLLCGGSVSSYVALNGSFVEFLGDAIFKQMISAAHADSGLAKNYLCFLHPGAPPRWQFDSFLSSETPIINGQATREYIPHPVVKNTLKNGESYLDEYTGQNSDTTYETGKSPHQYFDKDGAVKNIYLPKIWDITLPEWSGGKAVYNSESPFLMSDLLINTMIIRGFDLPADFGHFGGPSYLIQPDRAKPSISGLVADLSMLNGRSLPALALSSNPSRPLGFKSEQAKISLGSSGSSPNKASDILRSFIRNNNLVDNHKGNRALMDAALENAMTKFQAASEKMNPNTKALYTDNKAVDTIVELMKSNDIIGDFANTVTKYKQLSMACAEKYPGLIAELKLTKDESGKYTKHPYAKDEYSSSFALAEVFIRNGLTSSFTFICPGSVNPGSYANQSNNPNGALNDEHQVSNRQLSFMGHHWRARAFMSSVLEFKKSLGAAIWKDTVIQYGAEYGRSPNKSSGGSDHGINACSTTVISGSFDSFLPIGNIQKTKAKDPNHSNYGTYGVTAPTDIDGIGPTTIDNIIVMNTILKVLNIDSPFRTKYSLVKKSGEAFRINVETPKNVDS